MFKSGQKCVLVIDGALPAGVAANTAAILGITLGKRFPETVSYTHLTLPTTSRV